MYDTVFKMYKILTYVVKRRIIIRVSLLEYSQHSINKLPFYFTPTVAFFSIGSIPIIGICPLMITGVALRIH